MKRRVSYIGPGDDEVKQMLYFLGIKSIDELYKDVPRKFMLNSPIDIPGPYTEQELFSHINDLLNKIKFIPPSNVFCGGVTLFPVPSALIYILSRTEFLTSYTPYQPEINQGILQALFEYQSLIAELTCMDVVNASMYDWSSSAAEACLMANRLDKQQRNKVLLLGELPKERKYVINTYLSPQNITVDIIKTSDKDRLIDMDTFNNIINEYSAVYLEIPYLSGAIEHKVKELVEIAHDNDVVFILGMDIWLLPLLKPPGELGVDIFVSDGQGYGLPPNYGGPLLGIFAVKGDLRFIRQMPGRIIGMGEDIDGNRAFTMILQTREQHIRREKATSNICTNEALLAIAVAIFISLIGPRGLLDSALKMVKLAHMLSNKLRDLGFDAPPYPAKFGREFIYSSNEYDLNKLITEGVKRGYLLGRIIDDEYKTKYGNSIHVAINGFHTDNDIMNYISVVEEVIK